MSSWKRRKGRNRFLTSDTTAALFLSQYHEATGMQRPPDPGIDRTFECEDKAWKRSPENPHIVWEQPHTETLPETSPPALRVGQVMDEML